MTEPHPAITDELQPADAHRALRLGFTRGTTPSKWAKRWQQAVGTALELVPMSRAFGIDPRVPEGGPVDIVLERARPGERPEGITVDPPTRHAMLLYSEAVALVVPADHELADEPSIDIADLALVALLDHPDHAAQWPAATPWADPAWMPRNAAAALALVAAGTGAMLLPLPLARHLASKREHVIIPVTGDPALEGSTIWASWELDRDAADVQQLAGIMRGRTARSSRLSAADAEGIAESSQAQQGGGGSARPKSGSSPQAKKSGPKPGSRGAQLAASKAKAERKQAERRKASRRKRR